MLFLSLAETKTTMVGQGALLQGLDILPTVTENTRLLKQQLQSCWGWLTGTTMWCLHAWVNTFPSHINVNTADRCNHLGHPAGPLSPHGRQINFKVCLPCTSCTSIACSCCTSSPQHTTLQRTKKVPNKNTAPPTHPYEEHLDDLDY